MTWLGWRLYEGQVRLSREGNRTHGGLYRKGISGRRQIEVCGRQLRGDLFDGCLTERDAMWLLLKSHMEGGRARQNDDRVRIPLSGQKVPHTQMVRLVLATHTNWLRLPYLNNYGAPPPARLINWLIDDLNLLSNMSPLDANEAEATRKTIALTRTHRRTSSSIS